MGKEEVEETQASRVGWFVIVQVEFGEDFHVG